MQTIRIHTATEAKVEDERGIIMWAWGNTVPTDGSSGYGTGCLFSHRDGGVGTSLYVNEGSETSSDFNAK